MKPVRSNIQISNDVSITCVHNMCMHSHYTLYIVHVHVHCTCICRSVQCYYYSFSFFYSNSSFILLDITMLILTQVKQRKSSLDYDP